MEKDEKKTHSDQTNGSLFEIWGTNCRGPVQGGVVVNLSNLNKKSTTGKDEKKTNSKFHCDQTNGSWFKIRGTNFGGQVH